MTIIDGAKIAQKIKEKIKKEIARKKIQPILAVILVGDDPSSQLYVKIKEKSCQEIGIGFQKFLLPATSDQKTVLELISKLNSDPKISGIIVQLPLPVHLDTEKIINTISPQKDADGLRKKSTVIAPTAAAIMKVLKEYQIPLKGKNVCMVGYGRLVGQPLAPLLKKVGAKLTICDQKTKDLATKTKKADILISATGVPHLITANMVKKNAVIIDAGTSMEKIQNSKFLCGR